MLSAASFAMGERETPATLTPAVIVDLSGIKHEVSSLSCDGKNYFDFKDGSVTLEVPFSKIKKLQVLKKERDLLLVKVIFVNGRERTFKIEADVECVGATPYGTLDAYLSQIKEIDFKTPQ